MMKSAWQNMTEKLHSLGIYSNRTDTVIDKELRTYGTALADVTTTADSLLREIITDTATDYGLSLREKLWGVVRSDVSLEERRENIRKRMTINANDFTLEGMTAFLSSLGIEAEITEVNDQYRIYIHVTNGENFSIPIRKYLTQQINEYFPAHCMVFTDYRTNGDWDSLDARRILFGVYDSYHYTWDDLENFE